MLVPVKGAVERGGERATRVGKQRAVKAAGRKRVEKEKRDKETKKRDKETTVGVERLWQEYLGESAGRYAAEQRRGKDEVLAEACGK